MGSSCIPGIEDRTACTRAMKAQVYRELNTEFWKLVKAG